MDQYWSNSERQLWVLTTFVGSSMLYACRTIMPVTIVAVSKDFSWDKAQTGLILSAFFCGYMFTQVLGGFLSDRIGGETVISLAAVGWTLVTFWTPQLFYLFSNESLAFYFAVFTRILVGIFQGVHFPSLSSLFSNRVSESERSSCLSTAAAGSSLGTIFSGSVGSFLLHHYGWSNSFYFIALCAICWLLFLRYYLIARQRRKAMILSLKDLTSSNDLTKEPVPWNKLFKSSALWSMIFGHFCHTWAFFTFVSWLPTYFEESFTEAKGWIFNVIPWVLQMPVQICSGFAADYMITKGYSKTFTRKFFATLSLFGVSTCLVMLSATSSYSAALFFVTIAMGFASTHSGGIFCNPSDLAVKHSGMMNTAGAIPGFVGVYITGIILKYTHSWHLVFLKTALVGYIGWISYIIYGTGQPIL